MTDESMESAEAELDAALATMQNSINDEPIVEADEPQENVEEPEVETAKAPHPGAQYLDLAKATPEQIQSRLNYLTKQAKTSIEDNEMLKREYHQMREALSIALSEVEQIKGKSAKNEQQSIMATLKAQLREARDLGDEDRADQLEDLLLEAKLQAREAERVAKLPLPKQPAPPSYEVKVIADRMNTTDESGNPLYPYLSDKDPLNERAAIETAALVREYQKQGKDPATHITKIMDDLHQRMQQFMPKQSPKAPQVLSGKGVNLVNPLNSARVKLTSQERAVAAKLGLSEEDYFQSKQEINKVRNR